MGGRLNAAVAGNPIEKLWGNDGDDKIWTINPAQRGTFTNQFPDFQENKSYGGRGNDILYGSENDDLFLYGDFAVGQLDNVGGDDIIKGYGGDDYMWGGQGNDIIYTGSGDDYAYGGLGDDIIFSSAGNDSLFGDFKEEEGYGGNDRIYGSDGQEYLYGGGGDDIIFGYGDVDYIYGNAGDDIIYGGDDSDEIEGGPGRDIMFGGKGVDYIYSKYGTEGGDVIWLGENETDDG